MIRCPFNNCEECSNYENCNLRSIPVFLTSKVVPIMNEQGLIIDVRCDDHV